MKIVHFYEIFFANCTFSAFLVIKNLDQDPGTNSPKSLDPDLNQDRNTIIFLTVSYRGLRGSTGTSKKEVIILDLPTVYRGAITIIKGNESNPPVCKGPTQQRNACLRMVPYRTY